MGPTSWLASLWIEVKTMLFASIAELVTRSPMFGFEMFFRYH
jgi:hypothetical protein